MEIEKLKLVMELLQGLGEGAHDAFIFWVVMQNVPWFVLLSGMVWAMYRLISRSIELGGEDSKYETLLCELRDSLEIGSSGPLTRSEFVTLSKRLREMVASK